MLRLGTSPGGAGALLKLYRERDVRDALPLIDAPTLVVHPRDDDLVPPAMGRYLADQIPGARWLEVPGGDHFFFANDPAVIIPEIERFISERPAASRSERGALDGAIH